MLAALPMYDVAEMRETTDRFWQAIAERLRAQGIAAPDGLTRGGDLWDLWLSPDLLLAQTCGLPYRTRLHRHVTLVGTPDYGLTGCPPGMYCSVLVARSGTPGDPARLDGARLAYNDPLSQSGWSAPLDWAGRQGIRFGALVETGAHSASAQAVVEGAADIAGIDAVTWRLIRRYAPWSDALREIARTPPTPGLPLITAGGRASGPLAHAVSTAIADIGREDRTRLGLVRLVDLPKSAYLAQPTPPSPADYEKSLGV